MDGYRRLERTRSVSAAGAVVGAGTVQARVRRAPRLTTSRVAGAMRLIAFVGVLALIIGTSVSLASADEQSTAKPVVERSSVDTPVVEKPVVEKAVVERATPAKPVVEKAAPAKSEAAPADAAEPEAADAVTVDPAAATGTASGAVPSAGLPLTGDLQIRWFLLGGATLVLMGMLVQVAGQPLPARAPARR